MGWFSKFFKKEQNVGFIIERGDSNKVLKSEETQRPGFDNYFQEVVDVEGAYWGEDGYLYQGEEDNKIVVTFGRYNMRMNQGVCSYFGEEKCQQAAKAKGWNYTDFPYGTMLDKKKDYVLWYSLHDALVNM